MTEPTMVEVFLDVSCPWCHGGQITARRILDEVAADPSLPRTAYTMRFIRLHDFGDPAGYPRAEMIRRWESPPEEVAAHLVELEEFAASVGVRIDDDAYAYVSDPFHAHRLLAMVRDDPSTDAPDLWSLSRAVWTGRYVHGLRADVHADLRKAVALAGLRVPERIWARMADPDDHRERTLADHARALEVHLDGVPRLVANGRIVPCWRPIDEVRAGIREALLAA
ncbi:MAG: DsbA family protein [Thermoleophilia bacterium]